MNEVEVVVDIRPGTHGPGLVVVKQKLAEENGSLRLVGGRREERIDIALGQVAVQPVELADIRVGHVVGVKVRNTGVALISVSRVLLTWQYEVPRELPLSGTVSQTLGGAVDLVPLTPADRDWLQPGESRAFFLPANMYEGTIRELFTVKPERYWVAVYSGECEVARRQGLRIFQFRWHM